MKTGGRNLKVFVLVHNPSDSHQLSESKKIVDCKLPILMNNQSDIFTDNLHPFAYFGTIHDKQNSNVCEVDGVVFELLVDRQIQLEEIVKHLRGSQ
jgi:hypothetical protein